MTTTQNTGRGANQVATDTAVIVRRGSAYCVQDKANRQVLFSGTFAECQTYFEAR